MPVQATNLIQAKYASDSLTTEFTSVSSKTIVDKFTATNVTGGAVTLDVHIVPSGDTAGTSNKIIDSVSIASGATEDLTDLQNQILEEGDFISAIASTASAIVIRSSGRKIT